MARYIRREVEPAATLVGMERVAAMLAARREELAEESLRAIRREIPAYAAIDDPAILADVTEHVAEKTGCDLRRLADVQELLIAIRLGAGRAGSSADRLAGRLVHHRPGLSWVRPPPRSRRASP